MHRSGHGEQIRHVRHLDPCLDPVRRVGTFGIGLAVITVLGLAGRFASILSTRGDTDLCGLDLCGDALYYSAQAHVIGQGHGYTDFFDSSIQTADHPPLTAAFLAPVTFVLGGDTSPVTAQRLTMALVGAAVIVAIGLLGRKVGGRHGTGVGLIAAAIAAVNANFWMNDIVVMSETLGTLGIVVVLLLIYRFVDRPSIGRAAAVGRRRRRDHPRPGGAGAVPAGHVRPDGAVGPDAVPVPPASVASRWPARARSPSSCRGRPTTSAASSTRCSSPPTTG